MLLIIQDYYNNYCNCEVEELKRLNDLNEPYLLGPKLKIINTLVEKELNNTLAKLEPHVTGSQVAVLMQLFQRSPQLITQKELEVQLRLSHPTTRGIVKRLSIMGLIFTTQSISDRRQMVLSLTSEGQTLMNRSHEKIYASVRNVERKLNQGISVEERQQFIKILNKMITNF